MPMLGLVGPAESSLRASALHLDAPGAANQCAQERYDNSLNLRASPCKAE